MKLYGFWRSLATYRVRVALALKGLRAEEISIDLLKGKQNTEEYLAVNPQGVVPALVLDDGGPPLFQSLAILEYLEETRPTPALLPRDARGRARVRGLSLIA
ncbi:MAG TPA: glutathione S-transferase N-terminal domain-containing protein, partial [Burkholderiales bacterium]|nr:glutathione S-transferase N-terminal domain-containing protein [Burkholderiales bacterium]